MSRMLHESEQAPQDGRRPPSSAPRPAAAAPEPPTHLGPKRDDTARRERFDAAELATVLSHYDVGVIERIRDYPRGSRRAPKVRIQSEQGEYLLKRRAPGRDAPQRVAFAHRLQLQLAEHDFPVPRLIGTRHDNNSMLLLNGRVYEMFEYVRGDFFNHSNRASQYAGYTLARLHRLLSGQELIYEPPGGSYHGAPGVKGHIAAVPRAVTTVDVDASEAELLETCAFLRTAYDDAATNVDSLGFPSWRRCVNHGDWHPGNLLYRSYRVIAVIDFDSARLEPRIADVANGALQFAMKIGDADDPATWPDDLAADRIRAFLHGYDQGTDEPLTSAEFDALPWLVVEALIAESVVPIAATGSFARIPGGPFIEMIRRKVEWLLPRTDKLVEYVRTRS